MIVKTKILNKEINTPELKYAKNGDAGFDLTATSKWYDEDGNACYGTNRAIEIPFGYVGLLFPRSSNANKDLLLSNSVGVIDSGYRGEISMKFKIVTDAVNPIEHNVNDRIGQLIIIPYPQIEFKEVDNLSDTERGQKGYGSTGN